MLTGLDLVTLARSTAQPKAAVAWCVGPLAPCLASCGHSVGGGTAGGPCAMDVGAATVSDRVTCIGDHFVTSMGAAGGTHTSDHAVEPTQLPETESVQLQVHLQCAKVLF
jgi:hypothetical protein